MSRQRIGNKKLNRYRIRTGLDAVAGLVRGGSHVVVLCLRDGSTWGFHPKTGGLYPLEGSHAVQPNEGLDDKK